jgi:hypothetical protein
VRGLAVIILLASGVGVAAMQAIVERDGSNLRQGPGTNYPVVRQSLSGEAFPVLTTSGNWLKVRIDADTEAWVRSDLVRVVAREHTEKEPYYPQGSYLVLSGIVGLGLGLSLLVYHVLVARQRNMDYAQRLERMTGPAYIDGVTAADLDRLRRAFGISSRRARRVYHRLYRDKLAVSGLKPSSDDETLRLTRLQSVMGLSGREVDLIRAQAERARRSR